MHIVITDVVTCPRCGPEYGLIILADRIVDRRVREGWLGCANCREQYPVRDGVADLRPPDHHPADSRASSTEEGRADPERPLRLAALLGVTGPTPPLLLHGADSQLVAGVQEHLPEAAVVGAGGEERAGVGGAGMGWVLTGDALPFRGRSLGGVALLSGEGVPSLEEGLRCLVREARLIVDPAPVGTAERLQAAGATVLLDQDGVVVAFDPRAG